MRQLIVFILTLVMAGIITTATNSPVFGQGSLTLDDVDGLTVENKLMVNETITFYIRWNNNTGTNITAHTNGFRVYSPDGATWDPITYVPYEESIYNYVVYYPEWEDIFDTWIYAGPYSVTGSGADTIGFGGWTFEGTGVPDGFSEVVFTISTVLDESQIGKTLCLDSCWYPTENPWVWTSEGFGDIYPAWDGPHCFAIVGFTSCCVGIRGNASGDEQEALNISDITYLVAYAFGGGPAPECLEEGNVNGDEEEKINISDITYLVAYAFGGGPEPPACP